MFFSLQRFREILLDLLNVVLCPKVPHPLPCPFADAQKGHRVRISLVGYTMLTGDQLL